MKNIHYPVTKGNEPNMILIGEVFSDFWMSRINKTPNPQKAHAALVKALEQNARESEPLEDKKL